MNMLKKCVLMNSSVIWAGLPTAISQSKFQINMSGFIPSRKIGQSLFSMVKQPFVY